MADIGHSMTEEMIIDLEKALEKEYSNASLQLREKLGKKYEKFDEKIKEKQTALKNGKITNDEYEAWVKNQKAIQQNMKDMANVVSQDMTKTNQIAMGIINNKKIDAYALNHNYGLYEIENKTKNALSFSLYDHSTVERLVSQNPQLLPAGKVNVAKDVRWNMKHVKSEITQGVLQGEGIPDISKRLQKVTNMNHKAAVRNARTAMTGAQNAGRVDSYRRAERMGIELEQIWLSTLDGRTRHEHRLLMGQKRKTGIPFEAGGYKILYPGDPTAHPSMVYNCRCTLIAQPKGISYDMDDLIRQAKKDSEKEIAAKKEKFEKWVGDQVTPDENITSVWAGKKMSNIYYEIHDQNPKDANAFYEELGKLGKPSDVWNKYLTGQLTKEELENFEKILLKYLPKTEKVEDAVKAAVTVDNLTDLAKTAKTLDNMDGWSDVAKKAYKDIKWEKGQEMTFEQADKHKVNPLYSKDDIATRENCQTCAFTHECRRQGYNVVATPRGHSALQNELAMDQTKGWINKKTGKPPKHDVYLEIIDDGKSGYTLLNDAVKKNERYTLSVKWKKEGAHVVNIDRDENGVLRIIDNQRGKLEKNIWLGEKEISEYLDRVRVIKGIVRVDDCIPNPKFFNEIVKKADKINDTLDNAKTIKKVEKAASKNMFAKIDEDTVTNIKDHFITISNKQGYKTAEEYYTAWKAGKIVDTDLDDLLLGKKTKAEVKAEQDALLKAQQVKPQSTVKSPELIKAEEDLKKAQEELEQLKKALPANKTYKGIWKDDVSLSDYEAKKDKIAAKKIYYEDEIDKLNQKKAAQNWGPYEQHQFDQYQQYLKDLDDFEDLGKKYAAANKPILDAEKRVKDAKAEVNKKK